MHTIESYYTVLGIHSGATLDDIKRAFLEREQRLQQDFQSEEPEKRAKAQEKLRELFEAHEMVVKHFMEHGPPLFQENVKIRESIREAPVPIPASEPGCEPAGDTPEADEQAEEKSSPTVSSSPERFPANETVNLLLIIFVTILVSVSVGLLIGIVAFRNSAKEIAPAQPARQAVMPAATAHLPLSSVGKTVTTRQSAEAPAAEKSAPIAKQDGEKVRKSRKHAPPRRVTPKSRESLESTVNAAKQGDAEAQYRLGVLYDKGIGVKKDKAEAVRWYRRAAGRGHAKAQDALEFFHE
jgi:hypothetical protein